jgi:hypothetical protein
MPMKIILTILFVILLSMSVIGQMLPANAVMLGRAALNAQDAPSPSSYTNVTSGLVGWWRMDAVDISGSTITDASGNGNNGTLINAPYTTNGLMAESMFFISASSQYITIPWHPSLNVSTANSICGWVYWPGESSMTMVTKLVVPDGSPPQNPYQLYNVAVQSDGTIWFAESTSDSGSRVYVITATTVPVNTWTFIAATWDGTTMRVYINGSLDANSSLFSGSILGMERPTTIGATLFASPDSSYTSGRLDDVRLYNRGLSASEVTNVFNWRP